MHMYMAVSFILFTAISRKVVGKSMKVHMIRPKGGLGIHWNFAYLPKGNEQGCMFAREEFVFPLRRPFICSFTFTVACL